VGCITGNIIQEQYRELPNKSRQYSVGRRKRHRNTGMQTWVTVFLDTKNKNEISK
jgi:hypothetical protein